LIHPQIDDQINANHLILSHQDCFDNQKNAHSKQINGIKRNLVQILTTNGVAHRIHSVIDGEILNTDFTKISHDP
jgi:hypothetical protein